MLGEDVARWNAFDKQRANVADHGSDPVLFLKRVGRADRNRFLPEAGVQAAHDFVLAEELGHGVFYSAIEAHVVVEIQVLLAREVCLHSFTKMGVLRYRAPPTATCSVLTL